MRKPGRGRWKRLWRWGQYELARPGVRGLGVVLARLGLAVLAAGYAVALWRMPDWMHNLHEPRDRYNARLLVISAAGAVVVAVSLLYTARSYRLSHRGQVTDRFTMALERLSSPDIDARLGGIYALAALIASTVSFLPWRRRRCRVGRLTSITSSPARRSCRAGSAP